MPLPQPPRRLAQLLVGACSALALAACGDLGSAAYLPQPSPVPLLARLPTVTPAPPTPTPTPPPTPTPLPTPTPAPPVIAIIDVNAANVRAGPGTDFPVVGFLGLGNEVTLLAQSGEWYSFVLPDGTTGWVAAQLLIVNEADAATLPVATPTP